MPGFSHTQFENKTAEHSQRALTGPLDGFTCWPAPALLFRAQALVTFTSCKLSCIRVRRNSLFQTRINTSVEMYKGKVSTVCRIQMPVFLSQAGTSPGNQAVKPTSYVLLKTFTDALLLTSRLDRFSST